MILVDRAGNRAHNVTFFDTKENMDAAEPFFEVLLDHEVAEAQ